MIRATLMIAASLAIASPVRAECPMPGPICFAHDRATVVFVGVVGSIHPAKGPTRSGVVTRVQFSAVERLKGTLPERSELALPPSSEEFDYAVGQRVLVYASRQGNAWSTACTRTRVVVSADNEVLILRALRDKRRGGFISGYVASKNLRVTVARQGGATVAAHTDRIGSFDTPWLDPGTYVFSVEDVSGGVVARREITITNESRCVELGSIASPVSAPNQPPLGGS